MLTNLIIFFELYIDNKIKELNFRYLTLIAS